MSGATGDIRVAYTSVLQRRVSAGVVQSIESWEETRISNF